MRKVMGITLVLMLALSTSAFAKPADVTGSLDKVKFLDLTGAPTQDFVGQTAEGVFNSLSGGVLGTCYYGGTTWDVGPNGPGGIFGPRWEGIVDSIWTFDTGVNTVVIGAGETGADYPGVNPYKPATLHAYMEGWIGEDFSYSEITYFRLLDDGINGTVWDNVCVGSDHAGSPGVLGGDYSFYCGVLPAEAEALCYTDQVNKEGYGNSWVVCIGKKYYNFPGGSVTLQYDYVNETEGGFDFTTVEVDTTGNLSDDVAPVIAYDGILFGHENLTLSPGIELPSGPRDSIQVRFCFGSDGAWSDQDGLNPTLCGAFSVDNIQLGGVITDGPSTFEGGNANGWALLPPAEGAGGEWSNLVDYSTIPVEETGPCPCDLSGNVLIFEDLTTLGVSHNTFQDNIAGSPWIELVTNGDGPGKFIETKVAANLDLINYIFAQLNVKWFPDPCAATGQDLESPWTSNGFIYYFGGVPQCSVIGGAGTRIDFGEFIPPAATDVRIALGVLSYCRFFGDCSGQSNLTPVFDNVRLGVFGNPAAPLINISTIDQAQDAFPANGTLRADAPGRFDAGNIANDSQPEVNTVLGDTLTVDGATGGAEVWVEFQLTPGPGIDVPGLAAFYASVTARNPGWYAARLDTTEFGTSGPIDGSWMTTFHESEGAFGGSDTDVDPGDTFGANHLANDIFPDDLFTPGTRIDYFFRTKFTSEPDVFASWFFLPTLSSATGDTIPFEWECLPSSMGPGAENDEWNCVLYVDHFDGRGAQPFIETGLLSVLGSGSNNAEGVNWDRYDVEAPSSQQACVGRPLGTQYGATVIQMLGYNAMVWNSGNLGAFNLTKEDADQLIPWMTLIDFQGNNLYLSGDGIAQSMTIESASNPSALVLLSDIIGIDRECNTFRAANCPNPSAVDSSPCLALNPVTGVVAPNPGRSFPHDAQGNGCPQQRSFDVLSTASPLFGATVSGDEEYVGAKTAQWASTATDAAAVGQPQYRAVVDGVSVHYRRDITNGGCDFFADSSPVTERITEVLNYLGNGAAQSCEDPTAGIGVPNDPVRNTFRTALANFAPNPLLAGAKGKITFTMAKEGKAKVDIFDVNGRLVSTVFDEIAQEGVNEAFWNGTDGAGRDVASGVYFYRLDTSADIFSKKMVVVRNGGN